MVKCVFNTLLWGLLIFPELASAQEVIPLYGTAGIPGALTGSGIIEKSEVNTDGLLIISGVTAPTLTVYPAPAEKANGTAIVICPGGGYHVLAASHEGSDVAAAFNQLGITAFVLKYRLPDPRSMTQPETGPLQDAQRAMQLVRSMASRWKIRTDKIGIIGFSAGGHLASTAGTKFEKPVLEKATASEVRPDFMILLYPVISSDPRIAHKGSFENLLGKEASHEKQLEFSSEKNITATAPPTFLVHASDDIVVKPENSIVFYEALLAAHVPAELHLYQAGGHGFGLKNSTTDDRWMDRLAAWLKMNGFR